MFSFQKIKFSCQKMKIFFQKIKFSFQKIKFFSKNVSKRKITSFQVSNLMSPMGIVYFVKLLFVLNWFSSLMQKSTKHSLMFSVQWLTPNKVTYVILTHVMSLLYTNTCHVIHWHVTDTDSHTHTESRICKIFMLRTLMWSRKKTIIKRSKADLSEILWNTFNWFITKKSRNNYSMLKFDGKY
jgi:hypothetical protein